MVVRPFESVQGFRARRWSSQQRLVGASVRCSICCHHPVMLLRLIQGILTNLYVGVAVSFTKRSTVTYM